jgi:hypothetical protein
MSVRWRIGTVAFFQRETVRFLILGITLSVVLGLVPRPPAVAQAPDPVLRIVNSARDGCIGVGTPNARVLPPAQFLESSRSQAAGLVEAGVENINVLSCEKILPPTDRQIPPGYGVLYFGAYVARVENPTSERVMRAYSLLTSLLRARGTNIRETPVEGVGTRAVALNGNVAHTGGQQLDYQAMSAMIARGILFGAEARGEPGARRDLIMMITPRINRAIDAENW